MFKKLALSLVLISSFIVGSAQYALPEGGKQLNFGIGTSSWGLPVYIGMDFGVHKDISVGGEVSYRSYKQDFFFDTYTSRIIGVGANANYHFNSLLEIPTKWDLYAGVSLGFFIWSTSSNYPGDNTSGIGFSGQAGARYYFNDKWAINAEFGGGTVSGGKFGATMKF